MRTEEIKITKGDVVDNDNCSDEEWDEFVNCNWDKVYMMVEPLLSEWLRYYRRDK